MVWGPARVEKEQVGAVGQREIEMAQGAMPEGRPPPLLPTASRASIHPTHLRQVVEEQKVAADHSIALVPAIGEGAALLFHETRDANIAQS